MPEVFTNHYTFPTREAMPSAEAVRAAVAGVLGAGVAKKEFLAAGENGAWRDWLNLSVPGEEFGISVYWHPEQPQMEITSPGPMKERMIALNAAMQRLGGTPRYDDLAWKDRAAGRVQRTVLRALAMLLVTAAAVAIVVHWGWWGVLAVVVFSAVVVAVWFVGLARAFARG